MTEQSQRRNGFISLFIALIGFAVCLISWMGGISIPDGAPAYVALGGLLILAGLIAAPIYFRRARVLAGMMSGEKFLARWVESAGTAKQMEVVISTEGVVIGNELFTFSGYSCRLDDLALESGEGAVRLKLTLSSPGKTHRHKHQRDIAVPPGEIANAQRIVDILRTKYPA